MGLANVCNGGVEKQYIWKKPALQTGRKCCRNFCTADNGQKRRFWAIFQVQVLWLMFRLNAQDFHQQTKWISILTFSNRRFNTCKVVDMLGISFGWVQSILKDYVNLCWISTKFMFKPTHPAVTVHKFLSQNKIILIPWPSYSTDLVSHDLFLVPKLNMALKDRRYKCVNMIPTKLQDILAKFQTMHLMVCSEQMRNHWTQYTGPRTLLWKK